MGERHSHDVDSPARDGLAGLAIALVAVGCCAGLPLVAILASTVAVGTILGVAAGVAALAAVVVGGALWLRRRRAASCARDVSGRPDAHREASGASR